MAYQKTIVFTTIGKHPSVIDTIQMANIAEDYGDGTPRKRKRLTHLSPDEKMMRRKLKNRVAAQTARDRKKVLMQDLEEKVAKLEEEKKLLMKENTVLHKSTNNLKLENQYLKKQLSALATTTTTTTTVSPAAIPSGQLTCQVESTDAAQSASPCKTEPVSPGSAAPAVSLPKEQIQVLSRVMMQYAVCALTLSMILCCISWKNSVRKLEGSSRKRKQPRPARRPSTGSENLSLLMEKPARQEAWWEPQQLMLAPSMN